MYWKVMGYRQAWVTQSWGKVIPYRDGEAVKGIGAVRLAVPELSQMNRASSLPEAREVADAVARRFLFQTQ